MNEEKGADIQGEGDYGAARRYRESVKDYLAHGDVERAAREAAPTGPQEAAALAAAETDGRARSKSRCASPALRVYEEASFEFGPSQAVSRDTIAKHVELYRGYLGQTNAIIDALRAQQGAADGAEAVRNREALSRRLAFELAGLILHERLFEQMEGQPGNQGPARGSRALEAMDVAFGGYEKWRADVQRLSETRGVGWVVSFWDPGAEYLTNQWVDLHHLCVPPEQQVVVVLDLWEHAYLTDFGSAGRKDYVAACLDHTNWQVVARRFE